MVKTTTNPNSHLLKKKKANKLQPRFYIKRTLLWKYISVAALSRSILNIRKRLVF